MSKKMILFALLFGLMGTLLPKEPVSISLMGNLLLTSEQSIKDTYGNGILYLEIRYNSGSLIYNEFFIWSGMNFISLKGDTSDVIEVDKLTQFNFSMGCGYRRNFFPYLSINFRVGGLGVVFKDGSLNMEKPKFSAGLTGTVAIIYDWNKRFYTEFEAGYSYTSGKVNEKTTFKPGGMKFAVGLGYKFEEGKR